MPSVPDLDRRKPTTGEAGDGEPIGNSVRSFQSKVPLSERSATSAITMHSNSYSYLTERAYDYFKARSAWVRRTQSDGEDGASEEAAIKRLPPDFEPFFAAGTKTRLYDHESRAPKQEGGESSDEDNVDMIGFWIFRVLYAVFSRRAWDTLYLLLALVWSVLCPGHLDGAFGVESTQLASLLLTMFCLAVAPATCGVFLKAFFSEKLQACLHNERHFAGVFFVLAVKSIPVPAISTRHWCAGRRVHVDTAGSPSNANADDLEGRTDDRNDAQRAPLGGEIRSQRQTSRANERHGGGRKDTPEDRPVGGHPSGNQDEGKEGGISRLPTLDLPPRHWMCTTCKKVNILPDKWDGRPAKAIQLVVKRKVVDKQALYGAFKTKFRVPQCAKCQTPFNYTWRNGGPDDRGQQQSLGSNTFSAQASAGGIGTAVDDDAAPELWYGREFRRQLNTYFKPELERPSLSLRGGRYSVGARVACFAGKEAWYPGTVAASRDNNTYDVRYDNGDIAEHVFPHMVRFEPARTYSGLLCFYYGLALASAVVWPLTGFEYFSGTGSRTEGALVALPALVIGAAGVMAVAAQFWVLYGENKGAGPCVTARYATVMALPSASLALIGGLSMAKAFSTSSTGSWVVMVLVPSILFSFTGGNYAHAVSPAYGKAWVAASMPWLLFLLLVTLRLDGGAGDASPAFGRMQWLGVFVPLWLFLFMVIAAHHVLPYVWDIEFLPEPPRITRGRKRWLFRIIEMFTGAAGGFVLCFRGLAARETTAKDGGKDTSEEEKIQEDEGA